jgi:hypothetical protein
MRGPRGVYSQSLDPLTALGIEARSADERLRYAELQVRSKRQRVDNKLAYQRALATDLMKQPERNIHLTKSLLNHSNIATTLSYIEVDYDHMRTVLHERSLAQGAITFERRVDEQIPTCAHPPLAVPAAAPEPPLLLVAPNALECESTLEDMLEKIEFIHKTSDPST